MSLLCKNGQYIVSVYSVKLQFHEPSLPFGPTIETGLKNMKSILYGLSENEKHAKQ